MCGDCSFAETRRENEHANRLPPSCGKDFLPLRKNCRRRPSGRAGKQDSTRVVYGNARFFSKKSARAVPGWSPPTHVPAGAEENQGNNPRTSVASATRPTASTYAAARG